MKLNKTAVDALGVPADKTETLVWDDDVPGFGVRLRAGGSRTWIFQYRQGGKQRRMTLGDASAITPMLARAAAAKLYAQVKLGQDPAGAKTEARVQAAKTVGSEIERFLEHQETQLRPSSFVEVKRHLTMHAKPLHGLQVAKVDRGTIADRLDEIARDSGPGTANGVRSSLSKFFKWRMSRDRNADNPVIGTAKAKTNSARERVLTKAEQRLVWNALKDDHYGAVVKLLALTGQRREEIGGLRWSEIDGERRTITLTGERTKNGRKNSIPLSDAAWAIIEAQPRHADRDFVFGRRGPYSGWADAKSALDDRIAKTNGGKPIAPWVLHDLRRTVVTSMNEIGVMPHIVEAVVNHVSGHKNGVAGVYNHAKYDPEKRVALDRWAEHLTAIIEGRTGKVIAMPARA